MHSGSGTARLFALIQGNQRELSIISLGILDNQRATGTDRQIQPWYHIRASHCPYGMTSPVMTG